MQDSGKRAERQSVLAHRRRLHAMRVDSRLLVLADKGGSEQVWPGNQQGDEACGSACMQHLAARVGLLEQLLGGLCEREKEQGRKWRENGSEKSECKLCQLLASWSRGRTNSMSPKHSHRRAMKHRLFEATTFRIPSAKSVQHTHRRSNTVGDPQQQHATTHIHAQRQGELPTSPVRSC